VQKRWIWIGVGLLVALCVAGLALSAPLAERSLVSRARDRGLLLRAEQVKLGWSGLHLRGVRATLVDVPGLEVQLDDIRVGVRWFGLRWSRLQITGGRIEASGAWAELSQRLERWRARFQRAAGGRSGGGSSERTVVVAKLSARWRSGSGEELHVSGLAFEDLGRGPARAGADRVTLSRPGLAIDAAGFECGIDRQAGALSLPFARAGEVRVSVRLGEPAATGAGAASPAAAAAPPDPPPPADPPGLAERWTTHPERVTRSRAALAVLRRVMKERLPPTVTVERLWLGVQAGDDDMAIGPSRLALVRTSAALDWSLVPLERAQGTPLELGGHIPSEEGAALTVRLRGGPVTFSQLGVREGDFGLAAVAGATLEGQADVELAADATKWSARGSWTIENLAVRAERIAPGTILVPRIAARGTVVSAVDGSSFQLDGAELSIGQARFDGRLHVARQDGNVVLDAGLRAPLVSCQALLDSAPRALLGAVAETQWSGTFSLDAAVRADSSALGKMSVLWKFENGCRATAVPAALDPERFRGPFTLEVVGAGGVLQTVEFGPGTEHFVSIDDISPYMEAALLVTEDGRFYKHHGFDDRAIESAIMDNVRKGRFVRGASTLSMQLAKNLYLSREKTLSRKLQEAALTMLIEQDFAKRELLELYLNVVEFGPGIYGIGPAAGYYFAQHPRDLSPAQAFFLASLLPAPTVQHFDAEGRLSPARLRHVQSLLRISHARGRLSEEELARALVEQPRFGVSDSRPPSAPALDPTKAPTVFDPPGSQAWTP